MNAPGYPQVVPQVVIDRLERFLKPEAVLDVLYRPAHWFGGKSAITWVADGDGSWEQALGKYEALFSYEATP